MKSSISRVLIANRGEVVVRVAKTLRSMGIFSVSIHTLKEKMSMHVQVCDDSYEIPGQGTEAYLHVENILSAAKKMHCDAIHPGWGFLAENAAFARACQKTGIIFIGPSPAVMEQMGDKANAKRLAREVGVPTLPSISEDEVTDFEGQVKKMEFPVLIKPLAGGGGKGMVLVRDPKELPQTLTRARREAQKAFGDLRLMAEKFLDQARHVEVQIAGDQLGGACHIFERDCTVQRRHQKVIEESPSPFFTKNTRTGLLKDAERLAQKIKYQNLGTVEFIVDSNGQHYFMEMNTRLQVEHAVTEMLTGLDLVRMQLALSQGEEVKALTQKVSASGHAMECRVYAEDPEAGFLPATGKILELILPSLDSQIRVDTGVQKQDQIGQDFDPLLFKVIVHTSSRDQAIQKIKRFLSQVVLLGVSTNLNFLQWVLNQESFQKSVHHTRWAEETLGRYQAWEAGFDPRIPIQIVLEMERLQAHRDVDEDGEWLENPWIRLGAWRLGQD